MIPQTSYQACIEAYLSGQTELSWCICLDKDKIIAGLGVVLERFPQKKRLESQYLLRFIWKKHIVKMGLVANYSILSQSLRAFMKDTAFNF